MPRTPKPAAKSRKTIASSRARRSKTTASTIPTEHYKHTDETPLHPGIGIQASFKKRKPRPTNAQAEPPKRIHHVQALPEREHLAITFLCVEGYAYAIKNRARVEWNSVPTPALFNSTPAHCNTFAKTG